MNKNDVLNWIKRKKYILLGSILLMGLIYYFLHDLMKLYLSLNTELFKAIINLKPDPSFLSDIAAFEGVLIGVSIPIALQVVTWTTERYRDPEIAQFFIKDPLYRAQYYIFFTNITLSILIRFLNINNIVILFFMFLFFIAIILIFYRFIRLVESYSVDTDKILLKILRENVKNILQE